MKKPIVEGIIAVANHKLRIEGIESYKKYLAQPYYFENDIKEARQEIIKFVKDWFYMDDTDKKDYTDWDIKKLIDKLDALDAEDEQ